MPPSRQYRASWGAPVCFPLRKGSRSTPSNAADLSTATPAAASAVGRTSSWLIGRRSTFASGRRPFHFTTNGTRTPPSNVVRFDPRKGTLLEPLTEVVPIVGPPLSL